MSYQGGLLYYPRRTLYVTHMYAKVFVEPPGKPNSATSKAMTNTVIGNVIALIIFNVVYSSLRHLVFNNIPAVSNKFPYPLVHLVTMF